MRHALPALAPIVLGLAIGLFLGLFVFDTTPAIAGIAFGTGAGLMGGAFLAALLTNESIVGANRPRTATYPGETLGRPGAQEMHSPDEDDRS